MAEITIRISDRTQRIAGAVLGLILVVALSAHLWSTGVFVPHYYLKTYVPNATGLTIGSPVCVDGIKVGIVNAFNLPAPTTSPDGMIELVLKIEKRYQELIRSDSKAAILSEGLLGNRFVAIQRGFSGSEIPSGGVIAVVPMREVNDNEVLDALKTLASSLRNSGGPDKKESH